jgi:hypothetical protein
MSFDLNTELARRHGEDVELLINISNLRFPAVIVSSRLVAGKTRRGA